MILVILYYDIYWLVVKSYCYLIIVYQYYDIWYIIYTISVKYVILKILNII